ncbi:MAG: hypothetical protein ACJ780_13995 [Solirubrobacteraceae bacterium]
MPQPTRLAHAAQRFWTQHVSLVQIEALPLELGARLPPRSRTGHRTSRVELGSLAARGL